jgi:hypothetical protein
LLVSWARESSSSEPSDPMLFAGGSGAGLALYPGAFGLSSSPLEGTSQGPYNGDVTGVGAGTGEEFR